MCQDSVSKICRRRPRDCCEMFGHCKGGYDVQEETKMFTGMNFREGIFYTVNSKELALSEVCLLLDNVPLKQIV